MFGATNRVLGPQLARVVRSQSSRPTAECICNIPLEAYSMRLMNLSTFKASLAPFGETPVRVRLPDGDPIPAHFHVTEVGHVTKRFVDCGGTVRSAEACLLQTWVPNDSSDHRLTAGKVVRILDLATQILPSDELEV